MSYDRTLHIPAQAALAAFVKANVLTGAIARHAENLAEHWTDADAASRAAFNTQDEATNAAIRNRIAYAADGQKLYVKEHGVEEAIAALAPIAIKAMARTEKIKAAIIATKKRGKEPTAEDLASLVEAFAKEQESSILLSLATGARILTLTAADWCALHVDESAPEKVDVSVDTPDETHLLDI